MLSRFVTTSRTRIINPRYVVPCTLYPLVITAPSLFSSLARQPPPLGPAPWSRVAGGWLLEEGNTPTTFFHLPSPFNPPNSVLFSAVERGKNVPPPVLQIYRARSPLGGGPSLPCAASTPRG